jgi:hypothetical protein
MRVGARLMVGSAAGTLVFAAACGITAPLHQAVGEFRLQSVAGAPVPAIMSGAVVIESESLALDPDGGAIIETVVRNLTQGDPEAKLTSRSMGTWSRKGERLTVTTPERAMQLRIEDGGHRLRTEATSRTGPGLDVYREYVYRRER